MSIFTDIFTIIFVFICVVNFINLDLKIIVFGNCSLDNFNKIDTSLFVPKLYLGTHYIEAKIEEDIHLKNQ